MRRFLSNYFDLLFLKHTALSTPNGNTPLNSPVLMNIQKLPIKFKGKLHSKPGVSKKSSPPPKKNF